VRWTHPRRPMLILFSPLSGKDPLLLPRHPSANGERERRGLSEGEGEVLRSSLPLSAVADKAAAPSLPCPAPMEAAAIGSQSPLSFPSSLWCVLLLRSFPLPSLLSSLPAISCQEPRAPFLSTIRAAFCCVVVQFAVELRGCSGCPSLYLSRGCGCSW
jgi:hypothetical protein